MRRSRTKRERLRTRCEIDRVFAEGRTVSCRGMRVAFAPNGTERNRTAVIPGRGHRGAVARNRSRRLGTEAFRSIRERVATGFDFAIICYPGDYRYEDRRQQLLQLLQREQLLSGRSNHT